VPVPTAAPPPLLLPEKSEPFRVGTVISFSDPTVSELVAEALYLYQEQLNT
jgi:hypothetical protein